MFDRADGYYDDQGVWQRTKFCFVYCGARCTCKPPNGYYSKDHDKGGDHHGQAQAPEAEAREAGVLKK